MFTFFCCCQCNLNIQLMKHYGKCSHKFTIIRYTKKHHERLKTLCSICSVVHKTPQGTCNISVECQIHSVNVYDNGCLDT
jgi:hypothetical protein